MRQSRPCWRWVTLDEMLHLIIHLCIFKAATCSTAMLRHFTRRGFTHTQKMFSLSGCWREYNSVYLATAAQWCFMRACYRFMNTLLSQLLHVLLTFMSDAVFYNSGDVWGLFFCLWIWVHILDSEDTLRGDQGVQQPFKGLCKSISHLPMSIFWAFFLKKKKLTD